MINDGFYILVVREANSLSKNFLLKENTAWLCRMPQSLDFLCPISSTVRVIKYTLKTIKTIHLALLAGQLLFGLIVVYLSTSERLGVVSVDNNTTLLGPLLSITTILVAFILNRMRLNQATAFTYPDIQQQHYRNTVLLRCAIVESGNLFILLFFFVDAFNLIYLSLFVIGIIIFFFLGPSEKEFKEWYK